MHMPVCCSTGNGNHILTPSFWEVLPKTNPPKHPFHSKMISSIGNFNFIQPRYFSEQTTPIPNLSLIRRKISRSGYLIVLGLRFRFKSLSNQEKLDVITIRDREFIQKFLKFSGEEYEGRLINFGRGCSIRNILPGESHKSNFPTIKTYLCVALTGEPLLFVSCESAKLCQQIIDWLN